MDLIESPFVLFLLGLLAALVGRILEAAVRHVFADQRAHVEQTVRLAALEEKVERVLRQNSAIWKRLTAVVGA